MTLLPVTWPSFTIVFVTAGALVIARSGVFLIWEHAAFDGDQAVFGLMAKHIIEGRALPVFLYGQQYLLAVQAWLAAPFFAVLGPSVAVLKLPLVTLNVVTAVLLIWLLHRDGGLKPWVALLASLFYVAAPPGIAASLVDAAASNAEQFLYVLLLWMLRGRPLLFGLVLGVGFLHREFTAYGAAAIVLIAFLENPRVTPDRLRAVAMAGIGYMIVWQLARIAFLYSTPNGPGSAISAPLGAGANLNTLLDRACWDAATVGPALVSLFLDYFAVPFGVDDNWLGGFGVNSFRRSGLQELPSMWPLLRLTLAIALARVVWLSIRDRAPIWRGRGAVGTFLLLVGLQSGVAYAVARCGNLSIFTFRYAVLALCVGLGVLTLFYVYERNRAWLYGVSAVVALWCGVSLGAHIGLVREFVEHQPRNVRRELATYLIDHGIRYARSDYWTAYYTTFLTNERIVIASTDVTRIDDYQRLASEHREETFLLLRRPCPQPGGEEIVSSQYWMCRD